MKTLLFAALMFVRPAFAQLDSNEIDEVCADPSKAICAELKFITEVSSAIPGEFMIQIIAPEGSTVQEFKASLWMDMGSHGHGSAPLKITPLEGNQFDVKNAHFVMMGRWLIRLDFKVGATPYHLEFPVDVQQ